MKIVLLTNRDVYKNFGGIETHNRFLAEILRKNGSEVFFFNEAELPKREIAIKFSKKLKSVCNYVIKWSLYKKTLKKFCSENNIDLIIANFNYFAVPRRYHKVLVCLQHKNAANLKYWTVWLHILNSIFNIGELNRRCKFYVAFDTLSVQYMQQNYRMACKFFVCPNFTKVLDSPSADSYQGNNYVYIGRLDPDKNVQFLVEMSNYLNSKLHVYGSGELEELVKSALNIEYHGHIDQNETIEEFAKYKFSILVSNLEGMPISVLESMSAGTPVIMRDTFITAKLLNNNYQNGVLINRNLTPQEMALIINDLSLSKFDRQIITDFVKNTFSLEIFETKWIDIITEISSLVL